MGREIDQRGFTMSVGAFLCWLFEAYTGMSQLAGLSLWQADSMDCGFGLRILPEPGQVSS